MAAPFLFDSLTKLLEPWLFSFLSGWFLKEQDGGMAALALVLFILLNFNVDKAWDFLLSASAYLSDCDVEPFFDGL